MELESAGRVVPSALMEGVTERETAIMREKINRNVGFIINQFNYMLKKKNIEYLQSNQVEFKKSQLQKYRIRSPFQQQRI